MKVNGGYDWFRYSVVNSDGCSCNVYEESKVYKIINNNRFNQDPIEYACKKCKSVNELTASYISYVDEEAFLSNPSKYIDNAYDKSENDAMDYRLTKLRQDGKWNCKSPHGRAETFLCEFTFTNIIAYAKI